MTRTETQTRGPLGSTCPIASRWTTLGTAVGLLVLTSCDDPQFAYREGERMTVTVLERVNSWRGECVPMEPGDTFTLTLGEFDTTKSTCEEGFEEVCRQAPLVPEVPEFASGAVTQCHTGELDDRLALYCQGEEDAGCFSTLALHVSPILSRGQAVTEKGYLVVRWNVDVGTETDAGSFVPCLDGCEEGFRVRIEMIDR